MTQTQERVLVVEGNPDISDLISRQTLEPMGYQVKIIRDAPTAIQEAVKFAPDVAIVNLNLSGLSGKDLLVAFSSQGLAMPVIVIANEGMEWDVIQAFRLGASDYLNSPIREAEVVSAVERAMTQVRNVRDREQLARKVERTNTELQRRVRELTTILGIGKAVTSMADRDALFDKIIEGAVVVTEADKGWFLLREENSRIFNLSAQFNLPQSLIDKMNTPWDDGISSLVVLSGEPLSIHGPQIRRLKVSRYGRSVLVVPIKIGKEIVGLLVVVRDEPAPFTQSNKTLLEALADFASISIVNVKLFQTVEHRARSLMQLAETARDRKKLKSDILHNLHIELQTSLTAIAHHLQILADDRNNPLDEQKQNNIRFIREELRQADMIASGLNLLNHANAPMKMVTLNLSELVKTAISRNHAVAQKRSTTVDFIKSSKPVFASADLAKGNQIMDVLLSRAIKVSEGGEVTIRAFADQDGMPHISICDSGPGFDREELIRIFDQAITFDYQGIGTPDHLGIELALVKEIVNAHDGKIWVENMINGGSTFHFTLQPPE